MASVVAVVVVVRVDDMVDAPVEIVPTCFAGAAVVVLVMVLVDVVVVDSVLVVAVVVTVVEEVRVFVVVL